MEGAGAALLLAAGAAAAVPPPLAGLVAGAVSLPALAVDPLLGALAVPSLDLDPLPSPLKSVTYQPLPFKAKPAEVTCFTNVFRPQAVQVTRGGSLILRKISCVWWQLEQR